MSYGVFMNRLQFWEWGLWPWLGDVIASQPFLTLMVPVATLTGVVITTKSNERIRRRELQGEGERWRYEVVRDSAAVQRQAVLTFLAEVANLQGKMEAKANRAALGYMSDMDQLVDDEPGDCEVVNGQMDTARWFLNEAITRVLTLELSLADPVVRSNAVVVRQAMETDKSRYYAPEGEPKQILPNPYVDELLTETYPMSKAVETALEELKEAAINRLHPLPPEVSMEQPQSNWWPFGKRGTPSTAKRSRR